jgi:hypothetical protein
VARPNNSADIDAERMNMKLEHAKLGTRVKTLRDFSGVPKGTQGVIDEIYETGVMVAWDLPEQPLPKGYREFDGRPEFDSNILRDGFDNETELQFLQVVAS